MQKSTYLTQDEVERCVRFSAEEIKEFFSYFLNRNAQSPYAKPAQGFKLDEHPQLKDNIVKLTADRTQLLVDRLVRNGEGNDAHVHPIRIEVRTTPGVPGASQIAVRGVYGIFRDLTLQRFGKDTQADSANLSIKTSGRMSFEINVKGVDKALPLHYLTQHWDYVLDQMGYQSGDIIDCRKMPMVIAADADGTTYGFPTPHSLPTLEQSTAFDAICHFLKAGGIYMIVSGNQMERTLRRVVDSVPRDLRQRVIVVANGASDMAVVSEDGQFDSLIHYRNEALSCLDNCSVPVDLNVMYIGDDGHVDGNDYPAFMTVGLNRVILVCDKDKADPSLKPQVIGGHEKGTARIMAKINEDIFSRESALTFDDGYIKELMAHAS